MDPNLQKPPQYKKSQVRIRSSTSSVPQLPVKPKPPAPSKPPAPMKPGMRRSISSTINRSGIRGLPTSSLSAQQQRNLQQIKAQQIYAAQKQQQMKLLQEQRAKKQYALQQQQLQRRSTTSRISSSGEFCGTESPTASNSPKRAFGTPPTSLSRNRGSPNRPGNNFRRTAPIPKINPKTPPPVAPKPTEFINKDESKEIPLPVPPKPTELINKDEESKEIPLPVPPKPTDLPKPPGDKITPPLPKPPGNITAPPLPQPPGNKPNPPLPSKPPILPSKPPPKIPKKPVKEEVLELKWPVDKTPFEKEDTELVIIFDAIDESKPYAKPKIKAATIEKLVEKATHPKAEPSMQKTFLLTYRSIITPIELLNLLKLRYSMPLPEGNEASLKVFKATHQKPIQLRVCQLLKSWIQRHFTDFEGNEELQKEFMNFAINTIKPSYPVGATLESILERQINGEFAKAKAAVFSNPPPRPIIPKSNTFTLLDLNPLEVARQLTIIETEIFRNIAPNECNGLAWSKKDAKERAPNILTMINRFNKVSDWVVSEIVRQETPKLRTEMLSKFIEIATKCKSLNNFNGAMEIISGLGNSAIHRLKMHWADLNKKVTASYNDLKDILSSNQSYKSFRAYLKTCDGPCIPYLGMYLTDLTFIEDGNSDKIGELHNFSKRIFVANVIQEIQQYQQTPYHLEKVPIILDYLQNFDNNLSSEEAYQISLQILPRGGNKNNTTITNNSTIINNNTSQSTPSSLKRKSNNSQSVIPPPTPPRKKFFDFGELEDIPGYSFLEQDSEDNIIINDDNSKDKNEYPIIIAGTIEKLIERITLKEYFDSDYLQEFLLTFRSFTTNIKLIELLIQRFNMPVPKNIDLHDKYRSFIQFPIQLRVLHVFKIWTENYPEDFLKDKQLRDKFFKFCDENTSPHSSKLKRMMKSLKRSIINIKNGKQNTNNNSNTTTGKRKDNIPKPYPISEYADIKHLKIYDFNTEEIARQLCLNNYKLLKSIGKRELLDYTLDENNNHNNNTNNNNNDNNIDKQLAKNIPNLSKFIRNSQIIIDWVLCEIFSKATGDEEHDLEVFKERLIFMLKIASSCYSLGNYYDFYSIFEACISEDVKNYGELWNITYCDEKTLIDNLQKYYDSFNSIDSFFKEILKKHSTQSPCIPSVHIYLDELNEIHINENNYYKKKKHKNNQKKLINMCKFRKIANIIIKFHDYSNYEYNFEYVDWIQNYIHKEIPRLASFRSGISFIDQFETLDALKIKQSIKSQIIEDHEVRLQLSNLLKESLKEQLHEQSKLQELYKELDNFKNEMRTELQCIYNTFDQKENINEKVNNMIKNKFNEDSLIEEWSSNDQEGFVYGWPEDISIKTLQNNGNTFIIFSNSYLDKSELAVILKLKNFYEQYSGTKNVKVLTYSGYIDSDVIEVAQQNNVELISIPQIR